MLNLLQQRTEYPYNMYTWQPGIVFASLGKLKRRPSALLKLSRHMFVIVPGELWNYCNIATFLDVLRFSTQLLASKTLAQYAVDSIAPNIGGKSV